MTKRFAKRPEFPVSTEISRSVEHFSRVHSRERARDTYKHLEEPGEVLIKPIELGKNIHNEYAHLVLAEQRQGFSSSKQLAYDIIKQEEDRKTEAFELRKYFRRVLFVGQPTPKCRICSFSNFTYYDDINRHMVIEHTHIYACIFHFAGCTAKFTNKAQWKCHVACEHLNRVCGERICLNKKGSPLNHYFRESYRIFARSEREKYNRLIRESAKKALEALDRPEKNPVKLGCPIRNCNLEFEGEKCWDERMEHIAKHIKDNAIYVEEYPCGDLDVVHSDDPLFVDWALKENILMRTASGRFWLQNME